MNAPVNICHDYLEREGCSMVANPENTMVAAENGHPGEEDLHFCDSCKAEREYFCDNILTAMAEGWLSKDELDEEIYQAKLKEGTLKS